MAQVKSFPAIYIDTTRQCNLNCSLCMTGSNDESVVGERINDELSYNEIIENILKPARSFGTYQIQYGGGEFFLRKDAFEIIKATVELGYIPRILTNGTLITDSLLEELNKIVKRRIILVFGINSVSNEQINKNTRDVESNVFFKSLELCKKHKIRKHVVVNVARFNLSELDTTFKWLSDNRISFNRSPFAARMSGKKYFKEYGFSAKDMEEFIHPALIKYKNGYINHTPFFLSPELYTEVSGNGNTDISVPQNPLIGCWTGSWITIGAEGNVSPCVLLLDDLIAGNIREKPLDCILNESEIFQNMLNRNKLKGKCGRCRYKFTCGGCRAMAYFHKNDYMEEDPTCFFDPEDSTSVCHHENETNRMFLKYVRVARHAGMYKTPEKSEKIG